jgi:hypothetical protein
MKNLTSRTMEGRRFPLAVTVSQLDWEKHKALGDAGEAAIYAYFDQSKIPYQAFVVPKAISERKFNTEEERIKFTSEFKKSFLIDALAKIEDTCYGVEVKAKNNELFVVNVRTYDELWKLCSVLPVVVYFYIKSTEKIYEHLVRDPKASPALAAYELSHEDVYTIPETELELVGNVTVESS